MELEEQCCITPEMAEQLQERKNQFTALVDADYQLSKLLPQWGYSTQPGSSYYRMKLAHDIMGVVFHSGSQNFRYVFHEGIGCPKTSNLITRPMY